MAGRLYIPIGVILLRKILGNQLLDIQPFQQGFLYTEKELLPNGSIKVSFYFYDRESDRSHAIVKSDYQQAKYGPAFRDIAGHLGDFITCETAPFGNRTVMAMYPSGNLHIFNTAGDEVFACELRYQDAAVRGPAVDESCFWCAVPERHCVISYSPAEKRVLLRIGGGKSKAFDTPVSVSKLLDKLYVCNKGSCKIRTIRLEDYAVKDYLTFDEPVHKYFKLLDKEYVMLDSGVYEL